LPDEYIKAREADLKRLSEIQEKENSRANDSARPADGSGASSVGDFCAGVLVDLTDLFS
jgi:hypothetical protein